MEQARAAYLQDHRLGILRAQSHAWEASRQLHAYCDALEQRISAAAPTENAESARAWLAWAREQADRIDPLRELPVDPAPPHIRAEALETYLDGWSAHAPEPRRHRFNPRPGTNSPQRTDDSANVFRGSWHPNRSWYST